MYLVTGAAGFIGSHLVRELNRRGVTDILVVDDLQASGKFRNLADCRFSDYMDATELQTALKDGSLNRPVQAVLHQGACTDTMERDGRYMMKNNFTFSKELLEFAVAARIPFVYASSAAVYGNGRVFTECPENERPLNVYGFSKLAFDQYVRNRLPRVSTTVVGLRYFNVYGPRECHKGRMASMVYQLYCQLRRTGQARLFEGTDGYGDGQQRRDFVFVGDVVAVNLFFADGPPRRGIFNVGTGRSRTFNDVAAALIELMGGGEIKYIPFPPELRGKYQSFTEADITALRTAGYDGGFATLEAGIARCVAAWPGPD